MVVSAALFDHHPALEHPALAARHDVNGPELRRHPALFAAACRTKLQNGELRLVIQAEGSDTHLRQRRRTIDDESLAVLAEAAPYLGAKVRALDVWVEIPKTPAKIAMLAAAFEGSAAQTKRLQLTLNTDDRDWSTCALRELAPLVDDLTITCKVWLLPFFVIHHQAAQALP